MKPQPPVPPATEPASALADARGAVRLAVDAVHGVTRIAEGLHGSISRLAPPLGQVPDRPARGIAGFVYRAVRGTSSVAGAGLDAALAAVQALVPAAGPSAAAPSPKRLAVLSALNGVVGDHLARTANPLAIPMELLVRGATAPRLVLLVHGLCMNDHQWLRAGHDHGAALAASLGVTPVYARYNSGRHVSQNAADLALQLEALVAQWPVALEGITIVGHSMGGLLARSAVHHARQAGMVWPSLLKHMAFLGTPHHGAPLERVGNWVQRILGASPYLAPFALLARMRSDGITDLRYGNLLATDWADGPFGHADARTPVALPEGVACFAIAGTRSTGDGAPAGDGLVSVDSAFGQHATPALDLRLPPSSTWVARGTDHFDLLSSAEVLRKLEGWLR